MRGVQALRCARPNPYRSSSISFTQSWNRSYTSCTSPRLGFDSSFAQLVEVIKIDIISATQDVDNAKLIDEVSRSFLTDTITVPTREMYVYAARASLGDDVYHEPSTMALEAHVARLTGKESGLFMPSGTMSNQVALRTHLQQPPYSLICDARAHIFRYEAGGAAFHSGAQCVPIVPSNEHHLTLEDIEPQVITGSDVHTAPTRIVALENTLNGTIIPQSDIEEISEYARSRDIRMHLDGARLWHVAAETGQPMKILCEPFDTVSLCFSKSLGAPVGSCLVGPKHLIDKARWFRKVFGGGLRQTGILAAAAAYALTHNFPLLPRAHALAKRMHQGLEELGVGILSGAETSMVFYDPTPIGVEYWEIVARASQLAKPIQLSGSRLAMHIQTSPEAVEDFINLVRCLKEEKEKAGVAPSRVQSRYNKRAFRDVYVKAVKPLL